MTSAPDRFPPQQHRSRDTLERIYLATEALLEHRAFAEISVQEITQWAECSVGSFYARFGGKDALLPGLYERYDAALQQWVDTRMNTVNWPALGLRESCDALARLVVTMYGERPHLMRVMVLFARTYPERLSPELLARRQVLHERPIAILERFSDQITAPRPREAIQVGLFVISAAARDRLLFHNAPQARSSAGPADALHHHLATMLYAYLIAS
jgi:AcrR family transcriptional regulator